MDEFLASPKEPVVEGDSPVVPRCLLPGLWPFLGSSFGGERDRQGVTVESRMPRLVGWPRFGVGFFQDILKELHADEKAVHIRRHVENDITWFTRASKAPVALAA